MKYEVDVKQWIEWLLATLAWLTPTLAGFTLWMLFLFRNE